MEERQERAQRAVAELFDVMRQNGGAPPDVIRIMRTGGLEANVLGAWTLDRDHSGFVVPLPDGFLPAPDELPTEPQSSSEAT